MRQTLNSQNRIVEYAGHFRLLRKVAAGGMATVYEAEQLGPAGFSKRIALKVIHEKFAQQPEWLQLFIDEAKLSANLLHGNIVQIYQLGETDGEFWMAMEYIQGVTLRQVINAHRERGEDISPSLAAYIASRVCRALDFAHNYVDPAGSRLDIVHRDVSPGNVLLTWDGHVKLGDFGIAKAKSMNDPAQRRRLMLGKKHYMSPEQMLAEETTWRSDVFSMGVVLFELLALRFLFEEDDTDLAVDEVTKAPMPAIKDLLPDASPGLARILDMSIARDPQERPTAAAMGRELDAWCHSQREPGSPERLQAHLQMLFAHAYQPRSGILRG